MRRFSRRLSLKIRSFARAGKAFTLELMRSSKTYRILVGLDDGGMSYCDGVEYEDIIWLVPKWLDFPEAGFRRPERMIRLDQFEHQLFPPPSPIDIAVNEPVPLALYAGELTPVLKEQYTLYDRPDFRFELAY